MSAAAAAAEQQRRQQRQKEEAAAMLAGPVPRGALVARDCRTYKAPAVRLWLALTDCRYYYLWWPRTYNFHVHACRLRNPTAAAAAAAAGVDGDGGAAAAAAATAAAAAGAAGEGLAADAASATSAASIAALTAVLQAERARASRAVQRAERRAAAVDATTTTTTTTGGGGDSAASSSAPLASGDSADAGAGASASPSEGNGGEGSAPPPPPPPPPARGTTRPVRPGGSMAVPAAPSAPPAPSPPPDDVDGLESGDVGTSAALVPALLQRPGGRVREVEPRGLDEEAGEATGRMEDLPVLGEWAGHDATTLVDIHSAQGSYTMELVAPTQFVEDGVSTVTLEYGGPRRGGVFSGTEAITIRPLTAQSCELCYRSALIPESRALRAATMFVTEGQARAYFDPLFENLHDFVEQDSVHDAPHPAVSRLHSHEAIWRALVAEHRSHRHAADSAVVEAVSLAQQEPQQQQRQAQHAHAPCASQEAEEQATTAAAAAAAAAADSAGTDDGAEKEAGAVSAKPARRVVNAYQHPRPLTRAERALSQK